MSNNDKTALTSPVAPEQVVAWADPASLEAFKRDGYIGAESGWMYAKPTSPTDVPLYLAAPASQHIGYLCVNKNWAHRAWPQDAEFVPLDEWEDEHAYTRAEKAYIAIAASPEAAPAAMAQFVEPSWKDTPPDWCTAREEEIWQEGYDCAMGSCRAAASAATPAAPSAMVKADVHTLAKQCGASVRWRMGTKENPASPCEFKFTPEKLEAFAAALAQPAPVQAGAQQAVAEAVYPHLGAAVFHSRIERTREGLPFMTDSDKFSTWNVRVEFPAGARSPSRIEGPTNAAPTQAGAGDAKGGA